MNNFRQLIDRISELESQRSVLLAALKSLVPIAECAHESLVDREVREDAIENANAAITSCGG